MNARLSRTALSGGFVVVAHLGLLWVLARHVPATSRAEPVYVLLRALPIQLPPEKPPAAAVEPLPVPRATQARTRAPVAAVAPPPPARPDAAVESSAITLSPGTGTIDWQREAETTARALTGAQGDGRRSLDARPQVLELPASTQPPNRRGDMTVSPDGTIGVWTRDDVYCESRHRLMDHFEIWASSIPPSCRKRTQPRPKPTKEWDLP